MKKWDRTDWLKAIAAILLAGTAAMLITSGVGTVCVAWGAENWEGFEHYAEYSTIYQVITVITLMTGFAASLVTYGFLKGEKWAFNTAIITMLIAIASGAVHMWYSNMLRGSTMPAAVRVYLAILTILFLVFIKLLKVDLNRPMGKFRSYGTPTGMALLAAGLGLLSTPLYAGPSHGDNLNYLLPELYIIGGIFSITGLTLIILAKLGIDLDIVASMQKKIRLSIE